MCRSLISDWPIGENTIPLYRSPDGEFSGRHSGGLHVKHSIGRQLGMVSQGTFHWHQSG